MKSYNGFEPDQRLRALDWLKAEYAAGRRVPPVICDLCGERQGLLDAHSEDYSSPFGAHIGEFGLCFRCHMRLHSRFRQPAHWLAYVTATETGNPMPPMHTRNFQGALNNGDYLSNPSKSRQDGRSARGTELLACLATAKPKSALNR